MEKRKGKTKTELANIALNKAFYSGKDETSEVDLLINNNHPALVVHDVKKEKEEQ